MCIFFYIPVKPQAGCIVLMVKKENGEEKLEVFGLIDLLIRCYVLCTILLEFLSLFDFV